MECVTRFLTSILYGFWTMGLKNDFEEATLKTIARQNKPHIGNSFHLTIMGSCGFDWCKKSLLENLVHTVSLKGQCHEIFDHSLFLLNRFDLGPKWTCKNGFTNLFVFAKLFDRKVRKSEALLEGFHILKVLLFGVDESSCQRIVNDYTDKFFANIFAKIKNFAKPF